VSKAGPRSASCEYPDAAHPAGATSLRGTVVSLPDGNRTCAYCGVACAKFHLFHDRVVFGGAPMASKIYRPGVLKPSRNRNSKCRATSNVKKRSRGVSLFARQSNERTQCNLRQFATAQSYETWATSNPPSFQNGYQFLQKKCRTPIGVNVGGIPNSTNDCVKHSITDYAYRLDNIQTIHGHWSKERRKENAC